MMKDLNLATHSAAVKVLHLVLHLGRLKGLHLVVNWYELDNTLGWWISHWELYSYGRLDVKWIAIFAACQVGRHRCPKVHDSKTGVFSSISCSTCSSTCCTISWIDTAETGPWLQARSYRYWYLHRYYSRGAALVSFRDYLIDDKVYCTHVLTDIDTTVPVQ